MSHCKTERIRTLNDQFRGDPSRGRLLVTPHVQNHPALAQLLGCVRSFKEFSEDNDPYHEHDFGAFQFNEETYFWKIDYYDRTLTAASPDAADEAITVRVLTVMHCSEY